VISGRVNVPAWKLGIGFMGRSGFILGTKVSFDGDLPLIDQVVAVEGRVLPPR
jgi:hypothetical protein